jgi:hypothetical protein
MLVARRTSFMVSLICTVRLAAEPNENLGFGTAWIQHSWVELRGCGGGIIAWKGTNTTFPNKYGAYISESSAALGTTSTVVSVSTTIWMRALTVKVMRSGALTPLQITTTTILSWLSTTITARDIITPLESLEMLPRFSIRSRPRSMPHLMMCLWHRTVYSHTFLGLITTFILSIKVRIAMVLPAHSAYGCVAS